MESKRDALDFRDRQASSLTTDQVRSSFFFSSIPFNHDWFFLFLDSYSACLIPVCLYSVFGRGAAYSVEPMRFYYVELTILFNFHVSHWEKYNTGVLYLPWGYDLGMWGSVAIYAVNWFFGADVWKVPLSANGLTCGHFLEAILYFGAMSNLPMVFYNLYRSYKDKTGKMRNWVECLRPLVPLLLFLTISLLWAHKSPNKIVETDARAVFLLTGTIFSNIRYAFLLPKSTIELLN